MYQWIKRYSDGRERKFIGKRGTKCHYAWELLMMGFIRLSKRDYCKLDISGYSEIKRITFNEASEILEKKGWKWEKF